MSTSSTQGVQPASNGGRRRAAGTTRRRAPQSIEDEIIVTHYPGPILTQEEVVNDRSKFERAHAHLMAQFGVTRKVPKIGGKAIDLFLLYREVSFRGGCDAVIARKQWVEVCKPHDFPTSFTNKSYVSRKVYCNMLWHFEMIYVHGKAGEERITPPYQPKTEAKADDPACTAQPPKPRRTVPAKKKTKGPSLSSGGIRKPTSARSNSASGSLRATGTFGPTPPASPHAHHGSPMGSGNRQYRQQEMHSSMLADSSHAMGGPSALPTLMAPLHPAGSMPLGCGMGTHRLSISNAGQRQVEEDDQVDWEEDGEYSEDEGSDDPEEEDGPSSLPQDLKEGQMYTCHVVQAMNKHWRVRLEVPGAVDMHAYLVLELPEGMLESNPLSKDLSWDPCHGKHSLRPCRSSSLNREASRSVSPPLRDTSADKPRLGSQLCRDLAQHLRRDPGFAPTVMRSSAEPAMGMHGTEHDEPVVHDPVDMDCFNLHSLGLQGPEHDEILGYDDLGTTELWASLEAHHDLVDVPPTRMITSIGGDCTADVTTQLSPRPMPEAPKEKHTCPDIDGVVVVFEHQRDVQGMPGHLHKTVSVPQPVNPTIAPMLQTAASAPAVQQQPGTTVAPLQLSAPSQPSATSVDSYAALPTQAMSPFAMYVMEAQKEAAAGNRTCQVNDLEMLESSWDSMTDQEKAPYVRRAHESMVRLFEEREREKSQWQQQKQHATTFVRVDGFTGTQGASPASNEPHRSMQGGAFEPGPPGAAPFATLALDNMMRTMTTGDSTTLQLQTSGELGMLPIQAMHAQSSLLSSQSLGPAVSYTMATAAQLGGGANKKRSKRTPRGSGPAPMIGYGGNQHSMHSMPETTPAQFIQMPDSNAPMAQYLGGATWAARQSVDLAHFNGQGPDANSAGHMGMHPVQGLQHVFDYSTSVGGSIHLDGSSMPAGARAHDRPGMPDNSRTFKQQRAMHVNHVPLGHMVQQQGRNQGWGMAMQADQRSFMTAAGLHSNSRLSQEDMEEDEHLVVANDLLSNDLYSRINLTNH